MANIECRIVERDTPRYSERKTYCPQPKQVATETEDEDDDYEEMPKIQENEWITVVRDGHYALIWTK